MTAAAGFEVAHDPPDAIGTILVLPGIPGSRRFRFASMSALAGLHARVVVTERPGFGVTPREPGRAIADHVPQICAVADAVGADRFAVYAVSGGATYGLACGALAADRVTAVAIVSGLVSTHDRPDADVHLHPEDQLIASGMRTEPEATRSTIAAFLQPQQEEYAKDPDAFVRRWRQGFEQALPPGSSAEGMVNAFEDAMRAGPEAVADERAATLGPMGFSFEDVRAPIRLFHGRRDTNVSIDLARDLVRRLPDATLTEWDDAGHVLPAHRIREVFDFLERSLTSSA